MVLHFQFYSRSSIALRAFVYALLIQPFNSIVDHPEDYLGDWTDVIAASFNSIVDHLSDIDDMKKIIDDITFNSIVDHLVTFTLTALPCLSNFQFYSRSSTGIETVALRTVSTSFNSIVDHLVAVAEILGMAEYDFQFYSRSSFEKFVAAIGYAKPVAFNSIVDHRRQSPVDTHNNSSLLSIL